ncbi:MAG: hypothetical protein ACLS95_07310 [Clostridia bacterium]
MLRRIKTFYQENKKSTFIVYMILRILVIVSMIFQIFHQNWDNVFLCLLTLILFMIPYWLDKTLKITLPNVLEIIILLFIFSAEILGEIQNFYGIFKSWDTILHTLNGFLCAAIGFSLIDILNRSEKTHMHLSPIFVAIVAFCFSMTIGVLWEFFEFGADTFLHTDMQKDRIVSTISSVTLHPEGKNIPVTLKDIDKTRIYSTDENGNELITTIDGGYLDIGINDTMKDLLVNFVGAVVFSIIGFLYIKNRDDYKFLENFIPRRKRSHTEKE